MAMPVQQDDILRVIDSGTVAHIVPIIGTVDVPVRSDEMGSDADAYDAPDEH
jgi:hypothetical protein